MVAFQHHERELRELPINTCDISSLLQADEAERAKDHFRLYQAAADMLQKWYETLYNATQRVERRLLDVPPQTGWHRRRGGFCKWHHNSPTSPGEPQPELYGGLTLSLDLSKVFVDHLARTPLSATASAAASLTSLGT